MELDEGHDVWSRLEAIAKDEVPVGVAGGEKLIALSSCANRFVEVIGTMQNHEELALHLRRLAVYPHLTGAFCHRRRPMKFGMGGELGLHRLLGSGYSSASASRAETRMQMEPAYREKRRASGEIAIRGMSFARHHRVGSKLIPRAA